MEVLWEAKTEIHIIEISVPTTANSVHRCVYLVHFKVHNCSVLQACISRCHIETSFMSYCDTFVLNKCEVFIAFIHHGLTASHIH